MDVNKLPKWAQERIKELQYQRDAAVDALNNFVDNQTPSNIYIEEHPCIGESSGPSFKRSYIQNHAVTFKLGKEHVTVGYNLDRDGLRISTNRAACTFKAHASNVIEIVEEKR